MNVLLTCAGRRVELLRMLQKACDGRVIASDMAATAPTLYQADGAVPGPPIGERMVNDLLGMCAEHEIGLIVPTIDPELPWLADAVSTFADHGVRVAIGSPDGVRLALDKLHVPDRVREAGLDAVDTEPWQPGPCPFELPVVVKPRRGASAVGVRTISDKGHWTDPPESDDWLVQPLMGGPEVTVDVVSDGERVIALGARERIKVRGGEIERGRTVDPTRFVDAAVRLAVAFDLEGPFNFQVFTGDGLAVSELNPRFGGGAPLSEHAGAGLANAVCQWGATGRWPEGAPTLARSGVYMARYDQSVFLEENDLLWR